MTGEIGRFAAIAASRAPPGGFAAAPGEGATGTPTTAEGDPHHADRSQSPGRHLSCGRAGQWADPARDVVNDSLRVQPAPLAVDAPTTTTTTGAPTTTTTGAPTTTTTSAPTPPPPVTVPPITAPPITLPPPTQPTVIPV